MELFTLPLQLRWSDLDPNFHVRHSVYYDWGAMCRFQFLEQHGLTPVLMQKLQFGPVILREEAVFRKEIKYGDSLQINLKLIRGRKDYSRWSIGHEIIKNEGVLCALVSVDGAWLNVTERKLLAPPEKVAAVFSQMPVDSRFEWLD